MISVGVVGVNIYLIYVGRNNEQYNKNETPRETPRSHLDVINWRLDGIRTYKNVNYVLSHARMGRLGVWV